MGVYPNLFVLNKEKLSHLKLWDLNCIQSHASNVMHFSARVHISLAPCTYVLSYPSHNRWAITVLLDEGRHGSLYSLKSTFLHTTLVSAVRCSVLRIAPNVVSCWRWAVDYVYIVNKKNPPAVFSQFFSKRLGIFNQFFRHLLYVPFYTRRQIVIQLFSTLTKFCHNKRDHPANFLHFTRTLTSKYA